jgi:RNA polymerase sigma-70 factor (ECF subfamily)
LPKSAGLHYSPEIDRRWRAMLMSFFLRRTHSRSEAEDLTQEALSRGLRNYDMGDTNARPYLFVIAANLLRDRNRRAKSHHLKEHSSLYAPYVHSEDLPAEDFGPERVLIGKERLQEALAALSELDQRTRDIFILFRLEKKKQKEIAEAFGISVSAVEKQIVKATAHLLARLNVHD